MSISINLPRLALLIVSCFFVTLTLVFHFLLIRFFSYDDNTVLPILDFATSAIRDQRPIENIAINRIRIYIAVDWLLIINALLFYSSLRRGNLYEVVSVNARNYFYIITPINIAIILIIFSYVVFGGDDVSSHGIIYREDGIGETMTVIFLIIAAAFFFLSLIRLRERGEKSASIIVFLALVFTIFFALEEVSWGQRIFDWSTPAFISDLNYQEETNFHNMLGRTHNILILVEFSFGFAVSTLIIFSYEFCGKKKFRRIKILVPDKNMLLFALVVPFSGLTDNYNELLEELVAVAVLFYAMKLWTTLNEISNAAVSNRFSRD